MRRVSIASELLRKLGSCSEQQGLAVAKPVSAGSTEPIRATDDGPQPLASAAWRESASDRK